MEAQRSLIAEVESAIATGSADQRIQTLRRITDLFMAGDGGYSGAQVDVFDDVITRLAERIEVKARAELANRLAPAANAPPTIVRALARDQSIAVAWPVLAQSNRLTDEDLIACAEGNGQDRLLAISKRASISEAVGDLLVTRGDKNVIRSVAQNEGARFSDAGYGKLVERSFGDDELSVCVGLRKDIPKEHFHALISKASEVVFKKLAASNSAAVGEVKRVMFELTGQTVGISSKVTRNYVQAKAAFEELQRSGRSVEAAVQVFASTGKLEDTIVAIAGLCHLAIDAVERIFADKNADSDLVLLLIKAADFSWPTAKLVLELRRGEGGLSASDLKTSHRNFERLQAATAKRVVRFYQTRNATRQSTN